jgi:lipopolysaccharide export system protein LptC
MTAVSVRRTAAIIGVVALCVTGVLALTSARTLAQSTVNSDLVYPLQEIKSPVEQASQVQERFKDVIRWVYTMFFIVAVLFILLAAYNYLLGGQDEKRIELAKKQLTYAVIAIVIALVAAGVAGVVYDLLTG